MTNLCYETGRQDTSKVFKVEPLECPRCKGPMRVMVLADDLEQLEMGGLH